MKTTNLANILIFSVVLSLSLFFINFHDVNASITVVKKYESTASFYCTAGSAGGGSNNACFEEYSQLPSGHEITFGGYINNHGTTDGQTIREWLYKDDGILPHYIGSTDSYGMEDVHGGDVAVEWTVPAGKRVTQIGVYVLTAGNNNCAVGNPSSYQVALYDTAGLGGPGKLLWNSTVQVTPCNGTLVTFSPNVLVPSNGEIWFAEAMASTNSGLFAADAATMTLTSAAGTYACCSNFPSNWGVVSTGSFVPFQTLQYNDMNLTGYPKTLISKTAITGMVGDFAPHNVPFPSNATIPSDTKVWLALEGQNAGTLDDGGLTANVTGIQSTGTVVSVSTGNGIPSDPMINYNGYNTVNSTDAPYSSLTYNPADLVLSPTNGNTNTQITASGTAFTASKTVTFKWDNSILLSTNPATVMTSGTGGFSGVTFNVPSSATGGQHFVNASDSSGNWTTASYTVNPVSSVSFRMALNDSSAIIPTGHIIATQNGNSQTTTMNGTSWANFPSLGNGLWNFTFFDNSNNFAVLKLINYNISGNFIKTFPVWEIPFNCVSPSIGYQSDFIIQTNDTDGHHITGIQGPKCVNTNELKYNVTFTANGQSGNSYNSLTRITMGTSIFTANPQSFKINNTSIQTVQTTGVNMLTNTYLVGRGLNTETLDYDILLTKSGATVGGASGGSSTGQLYVTNNSSCFAGVFNPLTNSCQFGLIGVTVTVPPIVVNPTSSNTTTINIQCQGTPYLTINNVNLGSNPLGFQIIGLPTTVDCGQNTSTPSSCPVGTTLQNGECITSATCPLANQLSNGQCVGPVSCPSGSNAVNGQCIIPATCSGGVQPVNGVCQVNGIIIVQAPPTNSSQSCGLTNPIACVTGSSQSEPATLTGVAPNGQSVAVNTVLTSLTNPELNNVSIVMIGLIITAAIGGAVYRYILKKEKSSSRKPRKTNGKKGNIEKFNSNLRKK